MRELDVGQHDRGQNRLTWEVRTHQCPDGAVRAVRADHIPCPPAVVALGDHSHPVGMLIEPGDFDSAPDVGALCHGVIAQRRIDIGLRCDHHEPVRRIKVGEVDTRATEDRDTGRPVRVAEQVVGQSASVENFKGACHGGERATGRIDGGPAFQQHHRPSGPGQVTCRGQSRRSGPDDNYVNVMYGHRASASGYQRRMSSGVDWAPRLKTKRQPGCVMCAALTIDSNSRVLLATSRTPAPMSTAS